MHRALDVLVDHFIRKHKIIDLTTTAEGLREHNALFSCRVYAILDCFVCHFSSPVTFLLDTTDS